MVTRQDLAALLDRGIVQIGVLADVPGVVLPAGLGSHVRLNLSYGFGPPYLMELGPDSVFAVLCFASGAFSCASGAFSCTVPYAAIVGARVLGDAKAIVEECLRGPAEPQRRGRFTVIKGGRT